LVPDLHLLIGHDCAVSGVPEAVQRVVLWTPFPYLIYVPANILIGQPTDIVQGLLAIAGWSLVFLAINRWLWQRGLRQYSGMGA
jgi:ABC-2 type transport system permease protein